MEKQRIGPPSTCHFFSSETVTFANRIEFRCSVEGEVGVVAEKIDNDFWREGLEKEGEVVGL